MRWLELSETWDEGIEPLPDWDAVAQPEPEYQFDHTIDWWALRTLPRKAVFRGHVRHACPVPCRVRIFRHASPRKWPPRPQASAS